MHYLILLITALLSAIHIPLHAFTMQDAKDILQYCVDIIVAVHTAFMQYIAPTQEGMESFLISTYIAVKGVMNKVLGYPPQTAYDYVIERAKGNPLEAIGALALVFLVLRLAYCLYRSVYRFFYWLLVKRRMQ